MRVVVGQGTLGAVLPQLTIVGTFQCSFSDDVYNDAWPQNYLKPQKQLEKITREPVLNFINFSAMVSFPGSRSSTPSLLRTALDLQVPPIDPSTINDIERHARHIATSVDTLIENLTGTLHSVSLNTCMYLYQKLITT